MSKPTYRHENSYQFIKKGVKHTIKEQIIDGEKGLSIKFLKKVGDEFYTFFAREDENNKGEYSLKEKVGETEKPEKKITTKDLMKMLKSEKLTNVINFIETERGTYKNRRISFKKNYDNAAEV